MSLVGPRPLVEGEFEKYFSEAAKQKYLSAKPGITGAWTTSGPNASNINYEERIKLETAYVEDISLSNDLKILLKTAYNALLGYGIWLKWKIGRALPYSGPVSIGKLADRNWDFWCIEHSGVTLSIYSVN